MSACFNTLSVSDMFKIFQYLKLSLKMEQKRVKTTIEERKIIINLHNHCKSLSEISRIISRLRSTIQSIIDRYRQRNRLQNNSRSGRPRKFNQYTGRVVIKTIMRNSKISAIKIVDHLQNNLDINYL